MFRLVSDILFSRYGSDWRYAHDPSSGYQTKPSYSPQYYHQEQDYQYYPNPHYPSTQYSQPSYTGYPSYGEEYVEAYLVPHVPYSSDNSFRQYRNIGI